jgi:outer membrane lipoprotein-sorting protein
MKKLTIISIALVAFSLSSFAQEIVTADSFFQTVSDRYADVNDYSAKISITAGKSAMQGDIIYKSPALLRIDFIQPADQVICFNRDTLTVYLPEYHAVLSQQVGPASSGGKATGASLASKQGLALMRRNYTVGYLSTTSVVALDEGSSEKVIKLVLTRRTVAEGFRSIILSVNPETKLIRRIEGATTANDSVTFDFTAIKLNQNIPDARFIYDSPASANLYNNFLFKSEN